MSSLLLRRIVIHHQHAKDVHLPSKHYPIIILIIVIHLQHDRVPVILLNTLDSQALRSVFVGAIK